MPKSRRGIVGKELVFLFFGGAVVIGGILAGMRAMSSGQACPVCGSTMESYNLPNMYFCPKCGRVVGENVRQPGEVPVDWDKILKDVYDEQQVGNRAGDGL
jgi:hypothetical protein